MKRNLIPVGQLWPTRRNLWDGMQLLKSVRGDLLEARRIVRVLEWRERRAMRKLGLA